MQDDSIPVHDPDQLVVAETDPNKLYLGNAKVVHDFIGSFATEVMRTYDKFLQGQQFGPENHAEIKAIIKRYGDAFMGRDPRYEIAPWQGIKMRRTLIGYLPKMKADDDPGEALFKELALDCVKACMCLADGMSDEEVGAHLKEILDDVRGTILGVQ